jgi:hypothetical protein
MSNDAAIVATAARRGPGAILVDLVAVLVLVGLALLGLATTFEGWGYLVVGLVAASLGGLIALLTRRLPVAVPIAALPIGAILLGGPVGLRAAGSGAGVPDLQTLTDVMRGVATGWSELLTTLPNVDLAGPPALVPFVLGYVAGAVSLTWAVRTRSAGGPVLPLVAVLVAVLLLRRPEGGPLDWYPVAFAAVAVAWMVFRGLRFSPQASSLRARSHGQVGRAVTAAVLVGAALLIAIPLTSGSSSSAGVTLRGTLAGPTDLSGLDSPLRRFRTFTEQLPGSPDNVHDKVLFTVTGVPRGTRVRMLTLDRYDGHEWQPGDDTMRGTNQDAFLRMDSTVDNPTQGTPVRVQVSIAKPYRSAWLPTVGSLTSLQFLLPDTVDRRSQLRYDLETSSAVIPVGVGSDNDYEFTAILPDDRLDVSMPAWTGPVLTVQDANRADPLIKRVLASPAPPMSKVFVLARYLRENGHYSNGYGPGEGQYLAGHGSDRIFRGFLLSKGIVGDDEQYAAAMAVLANRVGVPARVVVGALLPRDGRVRGSDVEAWVEVRIADGSWRTLANGEYMSHRPPSQVLVPHRAPRMPLRSVVEPRQAQPKPEVARHKAAQARDRAAAHRRSLVVRMLPWTVPVLLALVLPLTKVLRRRRRRRRGRPSDRMAGAWAELVDHARDLGIPVRVHASRPAQARVLALAGTLSREADDGVFALEEPDEQVVRAYWEQVMRERRQLGHGQRRRRRLWAPFSPVTLVRRPRVD